MNWIATRKGLVIFMGALASFILLGGISIPSLRAPAPACNCNQPRSSFPVVKALPQPLCPPFPQNELGSKRNHLILATQRTGSTWLSFILDAHPDIVDAGEYLSGIPSKVKETTENLREHLDQLYERKSNRLEEVSNVGFKGMYNVISWYLRDDFIDYLVEKRVSVVHLRRINALESYISEQEAEERKARYNLTVTGAYHKAHDLELPPITLDVKAALREIQHDLANRHEFTERLSARPEIRVCDVAYEHITNPLFTDKYIESIYAFLGADPSFRPTKVLTKLSSKPCSERVANWAEVTTALRPYWPDMLLTCGRAIPPPSENEIDPDNVHYLVNGETKTIDPSSA